MNKKGISCLAVCFSVVFSGCTVRGHHPTYPAYEAAENIPYLWPEDSTHIKMQGPSLPPKPNDLPEKGLGVDNGIIAVVNQKVITLQEFNYFFSTAVAQKQNSSREIGSEFYGQVLKNLCDRTLMLDVAEKEVSAQAKEDKDIEISDEEIDIAMDKYSKNIEGGLAGYRDILLENKRSLESVRNQIREDLLINRLERKLFAGISSITPKRVLEAYYQRKSDFEISESRDVSLIIIHTQASPGKAKKIAENTMKRLAAGADFATLAKEVSEGPKASEKGRRGYVQRGDLSEALDSVIFKTPAGSVSSLQKMPGTYFMVKCHEVKAPHRVPFEEVQADLKRQLQNKQYFEARNKILEKLRRNAYIETLAPEAYLTYRKNLKP